MKKTCYKCGSMAVWFYMPGHESENDYYCDDCVPRGCSCNFIHIDGEENFDQLTNEEKYAQHKDEQDRFLPCCEYDYNIEGYDN